MTDQRQHPRFATELDAEVIVAEQRAAGRTRDISKGGFSMTAETRLPVHVKGEVRRALVFPDNRLSEPLRIPVSVVWCTAIAAGVQLGIRFERMDPQSRGYLDLFIRFLDSGD